MIEPPGTNCPSNRFTPSRWELESRPLRELPRRLLCAISDPLWRGLQGDISGNELMCLLVTRHLSLVTRHSSLPLGRHDVLDLNLAVRLAVSSRTPVLLLALVLQHPDFGRPR